MTHKFHKFRWPPSAALLDLIEHGDEIESMYIAVQYRNGKTGVIASGMSETSAMRVALKFLLSAEKPCDDPHVT